jgi:hypothetical protein
MNWGLLGVAGVAAALAAAYQAVVALRVEIYFKLEEGAEWRKLIRQDTLSVVGSLSITNPLLAAILAVLLFR